MSKTRHENQPAPVTPAWQPGGPGRPPAAVAWHDGGVSVVLTYSAAASDRLALGLDALVSAPARAAAAKDLSADPAFIQYAEALRAESAAQHDLDVARARRDELLAQRRLAELGREEPDVLSQLDGEIAAASQAQEAAARTLSALRTTRVKAKAGAASAAGNSVRRHDDGVRADLRRQLDAVVQDLAARAGPELLRAARLAEALASPAPGGGVEALLAEIVQLVPVAGVAPADSGAEAEAGAEAVAVAVA